MKKLISIAVLSCFVAAVGCRGSEQRVQDEKKEAAKEIGKAEHKVAVTEADAMKKVAEAPPEQKDEKKIEATERIAEAEKKVDDEKVEATKAITDAEQAAGHGGSYKKE